MVASYAGDCHPGFTDQETEAQRTGTGLPLQGVVPTAGRSSRPGSAVPPRRRSAPALSLPPSTLAHCRGRTEVPFPGPGSIQTLLLCDLDQNTEPLKASALGKDVNKVVVNIRWYGLWKAAGPVPGT